MSSPAGNLSFKSTPVDRLERYIATAKTLLAVTFPDASSLIWQSDVWDLKGTFASGSSTQVRYVRWSVPTEDGGRMAYPLQYAEFAKALFVHRQSQNRSGVSSAHVWLRTIQSLFLGVRARPRMCQICELEPADFETAARLLREKNQPASAAAQGAILAQIANIINDLGIVNLSFRWKNPLRGPEQSHLRTGRQYDQHRLSRLPSDETVYAVAEAFRRATAPGDVILTSCLAILCSAPSRIGELLRLPLDCEVEAQTPTGLAYGLRWYPSKGGMVTVKWVPTPMIATCRLAIQKLRELTAPGRALAQWYEKNPRNLYLPEELREFAATPTSWRSAPDFASILGVTPAAVDVWLRRHPEIPRQRKSPRAKALVRFADVEKHILANLPARFPFANSQRQKFSELLFVVRRGELKPRKQPAPSMFAGLTLNFLYKNLKQGRRNIFNRLGIKSQNGGPIVFTSHQLRHWLNTIADRGKISELEIAMWSGRKNECQNATYNHVTPATILDSYREADESFRNFIVRSPVSNRDFQSLRQLPALHATTFGFCLHDYSQSPCERHRDCHNCGEHCVVKGLLQNEHSIRQLAQVTKASLERAELEILEGTRGADRWVLHQRQTLDKLESLITILSDPEVPNQALIMLKPTATPKYFELQRALSNTR